MLPQAPGRPTSRIRLNSTFPEQWIGVSGLAMGLLLLGGLGACRPPPASSFSAADAAAIEALQEDYVAAWLRDDTLAVLRTLDPDAVLLPAGVEPIRGQEAIRAYWWPNDGSRTTIERYTEHLEDLSGSGDVAYARGRAAITFTYEQNGEATTHTSTTVLLTVYQRQPDGRWRIAQRMWSRLSP